MSKSTDLFKKRLAALLLAQANKGYLKSRAPGFKTSGEILVSEKYRDRSLDTVKGAVCEPESN